MSLEDFFNLHFGQNSRGIRLICQPGTLSFSDLLNRLQFSPSDSGGLSEPSEEIRQVTTSTSGTLWVVATPIGNLSDLSPRALEVLQSADAIVAEDTRHSRRLLSHFGVHRPLLSLPAFDEEARIAPLVERLQRGENLALVSDAGTPGVSDPGAALVAAAWELGIVVSPIPGPSAVTAALSASGFPAGRFYFAGFLPRKGEARRELLSELAGMRVPSVIFEAGNRSAHTLSELSTICGSRMAVVARELSKRHEELARAPLDELAQRFSGEVLGEVVIVLAGAESEAVERTQSEVDEAIRKGLESGERLSEVAKAVAAAFSLPRQEIYSRALKLRQQMEPN